jgi:4-hydroxy-tetrahydrodipicolinate synthase
MGLDVGNPVKPIDHCSEDRLDALRNVLVNLNLID